MPQNKTVISGKTQKDNNSKKKFKVFKHRDTEVDIDIEIEEDGEYVVDKLSVDDLPTTMNDGTAIRWFNNFAINKKNGNYINQSFKVTIAGLSSVRSANKKVVILDGNTNNGKPYVFEGDIANDTLELTDGDPAIGSSPP